MDLFGAFLYKKVLRSKPNTSLVLYSSDSMGRRDFICLHICPHGTNVLKWYLRNVDVSFPFISSWIGEWRGLGSSFSKSGFFCLLRDFFFSIERKERKHLRLHWIRIYFLFFIFDFKAVETLREAERLVSLITNHQPKQDCRKCLCFLLWKLYLPPTPFPDQRLMNPFPCL